MSVLDKLYEKARLNPQKVAFPEATNEKMMQAAYEAGVKVSAAYPGTPSRIYPRKVCGRCRSDVKAEHSCR